MKFPFPARLKEFRDYVNSFYGEGGVYDLGCGIPDIEDAIIKYAEKVERSDWMTWGGGDSVDRERVRAILEEMGFEEMGIREIEQMKTEKAEIGNLMNDLVMLVEAKECYNETYYNSEYVRITNRVTEIGGFANA